MGRILRLALITALGVALICLFAGGVYAARSLQASHGYGMPPGTFLVALFVALGAGFGLAARLVMREVGEKRADVSGTDEERR